LPYEGVASAAGIRRADADEKEMTPSLIDPPSMHKKEGIASNKRGKQHDA
jgi:hypothetical protein